MREDHRIMMSTRMRRIVEEALGIVPVADRTENKTAVQN